MTAPDTINVLGVECDADEWIDDEWSFANEQREITVDVYRDGHWSIDWNEGAESGPFVGTFEGRGATLEEATADLVSHMRELVARLVAIDPTVRAGDALIAKQALEVLHGVACR